MEHGIWAGLRLLARQPLWRQWALASLLGRLPLTMSLLALALAGERVTGSYAVGAQIAAVATFASGLTASWRGRQLDSYGRRRGLQQAGAITAAVLLTEAAAVSLRAPVALLFALAVAQGVASAPLFGGFRSLLPSAVEAQDLPRANTLDAVGIEVAFVSGPAVAGILAVPIGPVGLLLVMAAVMLGASVLTGGLPDPPPSPVRPGPAPWRLPAARVVYLLAGVAGMTFGLFESALPARAEELGSSVEAGGYLLAIMALGSGLAGLATSAMRPAADPRRRALLLLSLFALALIPPVLAGNLWVLGGALLLVGGPIAPLNAVAAMVLHDAVPPEQHAQGFALLTASITIAAGLGTFLTGQLLPALGAQPLFAIAAALPLVAVAGLALSVLRAPDLVRVGS